MSKEEENNSEVARLLRKFDIEYASAQGALRGFAYSGQHKFITQRMENMRVLQQMLEDRVGKDAAARLVVEHMDKPCKSKEVNDGKE